MNAPTTGTPEELLLGWITEPRADRGLRFLIDGTWTRIDYGQFAAAVLGTAVALLEEGVEPGDIVPLILPTGPEFLACFFALLWIGAVPSNVPLPEAVNQRAGWLEQLRGIAAQLRPRFALAGPDGAGGLADALRETGLAVRVVTPWMAETGPQPPRRPGHLAVLQFSSGSRGVPRGVRITRANLAANIRAIHTWVDVRSHGGVCWLPLYHDMGLVGGSLAAVTRQAEHAYMPPTQFLRNPLRWLQQYDEHRYSHMFMPNFGFEYIVRMVPAARVEGLDLSSVRSVVSGAERVNPATLAAFADRLAPAGFDRRAFQPAYGMAEATLAICGVPLGVAPTIVRIDQDTARMDAPVTVLGSALEGEGGGRAADAAASRLVSCGPPLPGLEIRAVGADGEPLPAGYLGELSVRGPSIADGYSVASPQDAERFGADGWFRTGDAGFLHDGELYVLGRLGDSFKLRGRTIFMEDVELEIRRRAPGVLLLAVGGLLATTPVVVVVTASRAETFAPLVRDVVMLLAGDEVAVEVVTTKAVGRLFTSSGKPRRREAWRLYRDGALGSEPVRIGPGEELAPVPAPVPAGADR
ncbi:AMP-binding protein [Frankia sp. Cj5]|uniref:AMP-binding protein n=1 Tax=Frankia sp. Cj5 TaxID=2880978 RepID=UPI001EF6ED2B|nr:AMP-binding protein [Frankia sp. Cj5]